MNSYKVGESLEIMGDSYLITEEGAKHCRKVIIEYYNRSPEAAAALSNALGGSIEESLPELKFMDADVAFIDPLRKKYAVFVNGHVMSLVDEDDELALYQGKLLAGSIRRLNDSEGEIWFDGEYVATYQRDEHKYKITNQHGDVFEKHPLDYLLNRQNMGFLSLSRGKGGEVSVVEEAGLLSVVKNLFKGW